MKPKEIERESFRIIDEEVGDHGFDFEQWSIVRRIIHTTADFEYIRTIRFYPEAIRAGVKAITRGKNIITDTEMLKSGIRKRDLESFGNKVICLMNDPKIHEEANKAGTTRARAAVDSASSLMEDGIYAIGNAPTALIRILELIKEGQARPAVIIGFPVGFVNAVESKRALVETKYPSISNLSRKGGSNVAASVVNALIKLAREGNNHEKRG